MRSNGRRMKQIKKFTRKQKELLQQMHLDEKHYILVDFDTRSFTVRSIMDGKETTIHY